MLRSNEMPENIFDQVMGRLAADVGFRAAFAEDSIFAVQQAGFVLTDEQVTALSQLRPKPSLPSKDCFDERLVLCSSSGY